MPPRYKLNKEDLVKVLTGFGIAMLGAALTYLSQAVLDIDWGIYTPAVTAGASVLVNLARKWLQSK